MFPKKQHKNKQTTFDESHLEVTFTSGTTQLSEIRIEQSWTKPIKAKLPDLRCDWFNKTPESFQKIEGWVETFYQPTVKDIGTSIYVQVVPESTEMEYIGMPIVKQSAPLRLAEETNQHAEELFDCGKATFFVEVKSMNLKGIPKMVANEACPISDTLLKITEKSKMSLWGKTNPSQKAQPLNSFQMGRYPELIIDRYSGKDVTLVFSKSQSVSLRLQNNKIRDVLCLVTDKIKEVQGDFFQPQEEQEIKVEEKSEREVSVEKEKSEESVKKALSFKKDTASERKSSFNQSESSQTVQKSRTLQELPSVEAKSKRSEEMPRSPQTTSNVPQSSQIVLISSLRMKLSHLEEENGQLRQEILGLKHIIQNQSKGKKQVQQELTVVRNRLQELEEQTKRAEQVDKETSQQNCYLTNQCRILEDELREATRKLESMSTKLVEGQSRARLPSGDDLNADRYSSYLSLSLQEAIDQLITTKQQKEQAESRSKYAYQEHQNLENEVKELKEKLDETHSLNISLEKKIASIKDMRSTPVKAVPTEQITQLQYKLSQEKHHSQKLQTELSQVNFQLNELKLQVKELITENTYLRGRQKGTKGELKLQAMELRKLSNRFTQMITDKDLEIKGLKESNKELRNIIEELKPVPKEEAVEAESQQWV